MSECLWNLRSLSHCIECRWGVAWHSVHLHPPPALGVLKVLACPCTGSDYMTLIPRLTDSHDDVCCMARKHCHKCCGFYCSVSPSVPSASLSPPSSSPPIGTELLAMGSKWVGGGRVGEITSLYTFVVIIASIARCSCFRFVILWVLWCRNVFLLRNIRRSSNYYSRFLTVIYSSSRNHTLSHGGTGAPAHVEFYLLAFGAPAVRHLV